MILEVAYLSFQGYKFNTMFLPHKLTVFQKGTIVSFRVFELQALKKRPFSTIFHGPFIKEDHVCSFCPKNILLYFDQ